MFTIRQDQFEALAQSSLEEWISRHLDTYFPHVRQANPGDRFDRFVRYGIDRARTHGFETGPHVTHWLNLMALLGQRFDEDPSNPWVAEILSQPQSDSSKINALVQAAERKVWGKSTS
jgi:hypothetical protein